MQSSRAKNIEENCGYSGIQGLNTGLSNFDQYVMQPEQVRIFFAAHDEYEALFAYPRAVADGFGMPPVFSGHDINEGKFTLKAELHSNSKPRNCMTLFAYLLLPRSYVVVDEIKFFTDNELGFGRGTCKVNSMQCVYEDGREANFAKLMIAVTDRPALFLKVADQDGGFYDNIAIFFPAQVSGLTHQPVRNGEAFVLVQKDAVLTNGDTENIKRTFDLLVKKSYGNEGLYDVTNHQPIESGLDTITPKLHTR